ncbi:ArsR family transcriptional regulator [Neisseria zoodegmatis]|uniref:ArsR family transcriptional regulator n=1 Tax=Neisseria zoodegmatis TaxID=326523 RepID=A0A378WSU3_9NEIS|nr:metalloregulator ArsR/SmtB family transcription factor [Neisseria zoodegmatis]SUA44346.1 ArsR family transcriptional regulator [Neisseria zoodegmatis]
MEISSDTVRTAMQLKLIAHPQRLAIAKLLLESEHSAAEIAQATGIHVTTVSNHLNKMRSGGAVDFTRYHRVMQYRLTSPLIVAVLRALQENGGGKEAV